MTNRLDSLTRCAADAGAALLQLRAVLEAADLLRNAKPGRRGRSARG